LSSPISAIPASVYDQETFRRHDEFRYITQGWGLTNDGHQLIMSDGSSSIMYLDPQTREAMKHVFVTDEVGPVGFLDELEFVDGKLYANVWQTNFIAIIDPENGKIIGWIDLTGLNAEPRRLAYPYVLNGIADDTEIRHLLVTGKCWPQLYEIEQVPRPKS
jgi:glutamine cyclotransferase